MSTSDFSSRDRFVAPERLQTLWRRIGLFIIDILSVCVAIKISVLLQFGFALPAAGTVPALETTLVAATIAAVVLPLAGLYNRHWRYASVSDLVAIAAAALVSSALLAVALILLPGLSAIPPSVAAIHLFVLTALLSATRLAFRRHDVAGFLGGVMSRRAVGDDHVPILLVGSSGSADLYLRALWSDPHRTHTPVGVLENGAGSKGLLVRSVPVLGTPEDFEDVVRGLAAQGRKPRHIVFTEAPSSLGGEVVDRLIQEAERAGLGIFRLAPPTELRQPLDRATTELRPIDVTDLLERPQAALDRSALRDMIGGARVLVTGAGGSIGSELCRQIAMLDPALLVLVDSSEFNLYTIDMDLSERFAEVPRIARLCNVRDASRVNEVVAAYRPELVFHAAALKHVPMVETNPCEGVLTNIIGTRNVASACAYFGARAMVQVSTDKVVNPTSVMGATKRVAELYCQALDIAAASEGTPTRFMTVRFGNVLGSSGSLIPLFQKQLERGGPLTVTDPRMTRFFMTIREAVELTLHAAAHGVPESGSRGQICVLDMGEPVKIVKIARRMIRLAGRVPDRDIAIEIIGTRPGEKLFEELFDDHEERLPSTIPGVMRAMPTPIPLHRIDRKITRLHHLATLGDDEAVRAAMAGILKAHAPKPAVAAVAVPAVVASPPADEDAGAIGILAREPAQAEPGR